MTESELLRRIAELETQNLVLIDGNQKLREAMDLPPKIAVVPMQEPSLFTQEIETQHTNESNANRSPIISPCLLFFL